MLELKKKKKLGKKTNSNRITNDIKSRKREQKKALILVFFFAF